MRDILRDQLIGKMYLTKENSCVNINQKFDSLRDTIYSIRKKEIICRISDVPKEW